MTRRPLGFAEAFEERLRGGDLIQVATLLLAVLIFVLVMRWPLDSSQANESWYAFGQTRLVTLALLALSYGSLFTSRPVRSRVTTGLALITLALMTIPFDVAAYASSFPATPLWWSLILPVIDTGAFYGIGLAIGWLLARLRLGAILPLVIPAVLIAMVAFDVRTRTRLLNPLSASIEVASGHLALMTAVLALTVVILALLLRRDQRSAGTKASPRGRS